MPVRLRSAGAAGVAELAGRGPGVEREQRAAPAEIVDRHTEALPTTTAAAGRTLPLGEHARYRERARQKADRVVVDRRLRNEQFGNPIAGDRDPEALAPEIAAPLAENRDRSRSRVPDFGADREPRIRIPALAGVIYERDARSVGRQTGDRVGRLEHASDLARGGSEARRDVRSPKSGDRHLGGL